MTNEADEIFIMDKMFCTNGIYTKAFTDCHAPKKG